ncbi:BASS family bile acid:Na+ symporter [Saccharopolyspora lacisalsi]|uniref:BASS family bile acid:Na+ symporter n=1 Tax=Halosaccharopolyspora lacisalsi TaxID=1000566 RepID=A0A839DS13_9PSEU|nr:bile acid:sodium symporter family protein [Halosaccharopolyspora lacisalsi]MBA8823066.1 BASS family bile acid:Na+ symporter [Halosaccharopolyspora lacisalsi]
MSALRGIAEFIGRWFTLLVLAGAAVGLLLPGITASAAPAIPLLLGVIMFGMGLTLRPGDFSVVLRHPRAVLVGLLAQYVVMPLLGWGIGAALGLSATLLVGMVLVGSSPGGTASNVVVYLARGDVALSVAMTSFSTLLAPLLTPLLVLGLAGSALPVDAVGVFLSIVKIVLVPVVAGIGTRWLAPRAVERALPLLPLVSVLGIVVTVAAVVGSNARTVLSAGLLVLLAVVLHNACGMALGYFAAKAVGLTEAARRAVSVEVGMQNSGLAASLATVHFTPLAALPAAVFSVWHNLSGATVASFWSRRPASRSDDSEVASS